MLAVNATLADAVGRERNSIQWKLEVVGPLKFSVRNPRRWRERDERRAERVTRTHAEGRTTTTAVTMTTTTMMMMMMMMMWMIAMTYSIRNGVK